MPSANSKRQPSPEQIRAYIESIPWSPQAGPQDRAFYSEADVVLYGGAAGGGKGLTPDTPVATPYGFRAIGELKVGDRLCAVDGGNTQVIGVYPQPKQAVYRVTFSDGASVLTDAPHRWLYSIAQKGKWQKSGHTWKVGTTQQLMEMIEAGRRIQIPISEPLRFTKTYKYDMRVLDPYLVGALLGDGCLRNNVVKFTTADSPPPGYDWQSYGNYDYALIGEERETVIYECQRLGIYGKLAHEKFVPQAYLWGTVEDRWSVLQGLMDTDGTASSDNRSPVYFTSTSEQLAKDVQFLVRSLGGYAKITSKQPQLNGSVFREDGSLYHRAYTVYIKLPDPSATFRLERKRALCQPPQNMKRRITSIELEGESETVCIAVDHPTSLFIAGEDLIVTHNTDLAIGLAITRHRQTLFIRREAKQLGAVLDRIAALMDPTRSGWSGQDTRWLIPKWDGIERQIVIGSTPNLGDENKYQGRPRDLLVIDEAANMLHDQVSFLMGWVRSTVKGQRCRTLLCSNPPTSEEGYWLTEMFSPWLDQNHPDPAEPGDLRWYAMIDGVDTMVDGPERFMHNGEEVIPQSRTFIPARLDDNAYLKDTGYRATLQALPEPLRSQMLYGDFLAGRNDNEYQVIPSEWVERAMAAWTEQPFENIESAGVDPSRGGIDETVIAYRTGWHFHTLRRFPGASMPTGNAVAAQVIKDVGTMRCPIHTDVIGIGAAVVDALDMQLGSRCIPVNVAERSQAKDWSGSLTFANKRAELWWNMRDLLNPANALKIALPRDSKLKAELCAPQYKLGPTGIKVESKDDIKKRLGRSTDSADAVLMCAERSSAMQIHGVTSPKLRVHSQLRR